MAFVKALKATTATYIRDTALQNWVVSCFTLTNGPTDGHDRSHYLLANAVDN